MDTFADYLKKKYFPIKKWIPESEYLKQKEQIPETEFNKRYYQENDANNYTTHYEIITDKPTDDEFTIFLLDELLEQQKITARKTSIIAGIVILWLICSIVSAIIILVELL